MLFLPQKIFAQYIPRKTLDFETGDFSGWQRTNEFCCSYSQMVVTSPHPVRAGKYSARFEVRDGDFPSNGSTTGERSEVRLNGADDQDKTPIGTDAWYGFSTFIPATWVDTTMSNFRIIFQWHSTEDIALGEDGLSPPLSIHYWGGNFWVSLRTTPERVVTNSSSSITTKYFNLGKGIKGVWHDFIFHIKWSYKSDGYVDAWLDGNKVISYRGGVGYNDTKGPYVRMGIYRSAQYSVTDVVYHDEFRRGTSYAEVDPDQQEQALLLSSAPKTATPTFFSTESPLFTSRQSSCLVKHRGDANCDGLIDGRDFSVWLNSQCRPTGGQTCSDTRADFNNDGNVDDTDFEIWFGNRG